MIITDIKNLKKKFLGNYKLFRDDYIINQHVIKNKKRVIFGFVCVYSNS